jgi:hypothetical protein
MIGYKEQNHQMNKLYFRFNQRAKALAVSNYTSRLGAVSQSLFNLHEAQ